MCRLLYGQVLMYVCKKPQHSSSAVRCFQNSLCHTSHLRIFCLVLFLFFVSFILQILAFVLLRNVPGSFRAKFSKFYAWVGTISLEVSCLVDVTFCSDMEEITRRPEDINFMLEC